MFFKKIYGFMRHVCVPMQQVKCCMLWKRYIFQFKCQRFAVILNSWVIFASCRNAKNAIIHSRYFSLSRSLFRRRSSPSPSWSTNRRKPFRTWSRGTERGSSGFVRRTTVSSAWPQPFTKRWPWQCDQIRRNYVTWAVHNKRLEQYNLAKEKINDEK